MTAIAPLLTDHYRSAFDAFLASRHEPEQATRWRHLEFEKFEKLGLPTRQQEEWRFTDLSALQNFTPQLPVNAPVDAGALPVLEGSRHRLVFVNGRFISSLSNLESLSDRVRVGTVAQADPVPPSIFSINKEKNPFSALNGAFWEDGVVIRIKHGTVLETPIHVIFHSIGSDIAIYPRLFIILEYEAQATVVVEYQGQGRYLNVPLASLVVGDRSVLHYHQIQQESLEAFHLGGIKLQQGRDSQTQLHLLSFGGQLARTNLEVLLDGEHAHCLLNGLTVGRENQAGNFYVRVEHAHPYGSSQQRFKSVLDAKARSVFDGLIHVRPHAQKTDARQNSRNLLLSKHASAHSNPRLEILADDVKCSHGSSTGFLDPNAEFYLRARGISAAQARALLVYAFANDSLDQIRLTPLRARLARLLADRLALDHTEEEPTS